MSRMCLGCGVNTCYKVCHDMRWGISRAANHGPLGLKVKFNGPGQEASLEAWPSTRYSMGRGAGEDS